VSNKSKTGRNILSKRKSTSPKQKSKNFHGSKKAKNLVKMMNVLKRRETTANI